MKTRIKNILGSFLCRVRPRKAALLRQEFTLPYWNPKIRNSTAERLMRRHIARAASMDPTGASLEDLHWRFWANQDRAGWYDATSERFETSFRTAVEGYVEVMEPLVTQADIETVCEIGTGNGQSLAFMADRLSGPRRFLGLDLSHSQIDSNRRSFPHLEFVAGDALSWIPENPTGRTLYFAVGGVFEYVSRPSLMSFSQHVAALGSPCILSAMFEPIDAHHDLDSDPESRVYGPEHSFSHNYPAVLTEAGLDLFYVDRAPPLDVRTISLVATNEALGSQVDRSNRSSEE